MYASGLARSLARRGHTVVFAAGPAGSGPAPEGVDLVRVPRFPGGAVAPGSGPHWTRLWTDAGLVAAIRRLIARRGIEIVHAHHAEATLVARAALGPRSRTAIPLVHSVHASLAEELPQWFAGLRGMGRLGRLVDDAAARAADVNVAISPRGARSLTDRGHAVELVPPGVDLEEIMGGDAIKARLAWDLRGDVVAYTGNLDPYQELPRLLSAVAALPDATLLVATSDGEAAVAALHAQAEALGLPAARRRFVRGDFGVAKDAIAAASVFVVPRTKCAGFPMKLLNALGAGIPAVVASTAGLEAPGAVEFDPADESGPTSLPGTLRGLLADPVRRKALGDKAMWALLDHGTWDARAATIEAIYTRLLSAR